LHSLLWAISPVAHDLRVTRACCELLHEFLNHLLVRPGHFTHNPISSDVEIETAALASQRGDRTWQS